MTLSGPSCEVLLSLEDSTVTAVVYFNLSLQHSSSGGCWRNSMLATTSYNQESITVSRNYLHLYSPPTQSILPGLTAAARLNGGIYT